MSNSLQSRFDAGDIPALGFGAMNLSHHGLGTDFTLEEAEPVLSKAVELGCTFWDTAVSPLLLLPRHFTDTLGVAGNLQ
jgi:diketogulonate reductase-like aldo/keto reductase